MAKPFKPQPHKMAEHDQTIRGQQSGYRLKTITLNLDKNLLNEIDKIWDWPF